MIDSSTAKSTRAVFLDRDGVINRVVVRHGEIGSPRCLEEFEFEAGVAQSIDGLHAAGFRLFVVSNQPDVARRLLNVETLAAMTKMIVAALPIEEIKICPHEDADRCWCRKPLPGMILELANRQGLETSSSFLIGDSWKDAAAARAAGCRSIILDRYYNQGFRADFRVPDLSTAVNVILRENCR